MSKFVEECRMEGEDLEDKRVIKWEEILLQQQKDINRLATAIELIERAKDETLKRQWVTAKPGENYDIPRTQNFKTMYVDNSQSSSSVSICLDNEIGLFPVEGSSSLFIPCEGAKTFKVIGTSSVKILFVNRVTNFDNGKNPTTIVGSLIALPVDVQFSSLTTTNPFYFYNVGNQVKVTATITRPANTTAYTANKVVGNTTYSTISTGIIAGAGFKITAVTLEVDANSGVVMPAEGFRLHLYNASPAAIVDGAAFNLPSGDRSKYLGFIPILTPTVLGDTQWSQNNVSFSSKLASGSSSLYFYLETLGAWTPSSGLVIKPVLTIETV